MKMSITVSLIPNVQPQGQHVLSRFNVLPNKETIQCSAKYEDDSNVLPNKEDDSHVLPNTETIQMFCQIRRRFNVLSKYGDDSMFCQIRRRGLRH